jgi:hypothetical protein
VHCSRHLPTRSRRRRPRPRRPHNKPLHLHRNPRRVASGWVQAVQRRRVIRWANPTSRSATSSRDPMGCCVLRLALTPKSARQRRRTPAKCQSSRPPEAPAVTPISDRNRSASGLRFALPPARRYASLCCLQKRAWSRFSVCRPPQPCQANENALATNSESLGRYSRPAVILPVCCVVRHNPRKRVSSVSAVVEQGGESGLLRLRCRGRVERGRSFARYNHSLSSNTVKLTHCPAQIRDARARPTHQRRCVARASRTKANQLRP